jgi:hypothetical protein
MTRLTDEELADLERECRVSRRQDAGSDASERLAIRASAVLPSLLAEVRELRKMKAQLAKHRECEECGYMDGNGGYYRHPNCECGGMP